MNILRKLKQFIVSKGGWIGAIIGFLFSYYRYSGGNFISDIKAMFFVGCDEFCGFSILWWIIIIIGFIIGYWIEKWLRKSGILRRGR